VPRADRVLASFTVRRPIARDENIDLQKHRASLDGSGRRRPELTDEDIIKAPGAGVAPVAADDAV